MGATVDQVNGIDWNPLWLSFGKNPNQVPYTIECSGNKDDNDTDFFIEFAFLLENGEFIQFQDGLNNATRAEQWGFMPQFNLPANTTKEVVIDLTKGMGGDCFWKDDNPSCVQHFDMTKVVSMTYEIFHLPGGITDAKFKIHSLKVGEIDRGEQEIITSLIENKDQFLSVYPNPVQSHISVSMAGKLKVYSIEGLVVFSKSVEAEEQVDVDSFSEGVYLVRLTNEAGEFTTSFMK